MNITNTTGITCHDNMYKITPWQYYPKCNEPIYSNIPYENPFYGTKNSKDIVVKVDDEDPIFKCVFNVVYPSNVITTKTHPIIFARRMRKV